MGNNRGLTLIEVLLSLFIFAITVLIFNRCFSTVSRLTTVNTTRQEIGMIAKNKMEEIKSGYIYIDNDRYSFLDLEGTINFKEQDYDVSIIIRPLHNFENISYVNIEVESEKEDTGYNLIRYINLREIEADGLNYEE